ncbi:MAG: DUF4339 domain-containing protein [Opitutaceae bacterium]|nr:DUF4339 domain-containing protein [Verrucomicrobiales bacterium]
MEITYKSIGGDGKEYGPIPLDQLKGWVAEGRIGPNSQIWRSDSETWSTASDLPELGLPANSPPVGPASIVSADLLALQNSSRSGAQWFFWIAALSVINTISAFSGGSFGFVIGLGVTQAIARQAVNGESSGKLIALILNLIAVGFFVFIGVFARRRQAWAFLAGMVLYALDGLIFLLVKDWLGVGFHAFALWCIWMGFQANQKLNRATQG